MAVDYPKQLFCIWGGKKSSLSATFELVAPKKEGNTPPLEMHEGNLSRFALTLLDTSTGSTKSFIANIPAHDIDVIYAKTYVALTKNALYLPVKAPKPQTEESADVGFEEEYSLCYTQQIRVGTFAGKTPAEILLSDGSQKEKLQSTQNWLEENLSKYPNNAQTIEAIKQAIMLYDIGELHPRKAPSNVVEMPDNQGNYTVYHREFKSTRRTNSKGYRLCYNIDISMQQGMRYPWLVTITNYFSPQKGDTVDQKICEDKQVAKIRITDDDWLAAIGIMKRSQMFFELINFQPLFRRAEELTKKQIEDYNNSKMSS